MKKLEKEEKEEYQPYAWNKKKEKYVPVGKPQPSLNLFDILPRINPWDSLNYNNITTPYRSGYSMIFQDLATVGVPHLWMVLPGSWADAGAHFSILKSKTLFHG